MFNIFAHTLLSRHKSSDSDLAEFFHPDNTGCLRELLAFSINEFAPENVLAYMACMDYARRPTREKLQYIQANFLARNAEFETNIPNPTKVKLQQSTTLDLSKLQHTTSRGRQVIKPVAPSSLPPDPNLFVNSNYTMDLMMNIGDTYSRFSLVPGALQYKLGQTYVGHINIVAVSTRNQVRNALAEMKRVGFNVPSKVMAI